MKRLEHIRKNKTLNTLIKSSLFVSIGVKWTSSTTYEKDNEKIVIGRENFQRFKIITMLLQKGLQIF